MFVTIYKRPRRLDKRVAEKCDIEGLTREVEFLYASFSIVKAFDCDEVELSDLSRAVFLYA